MIQRPFPSWQSRDREHFLRSITISLPVAGVTSSKAFSTPIGFVVEGSASVNDGPENSPAAS